jgi:hypothetical protein
VAILVVLIVHKMHNLILNVEQIKIFALLIDRPTKTTKNNKDHNTKQLISDSRDKSVLAVCDTVDLFKRCTTPEFFFNH